MIAIGFGTNNLLMSKLIRWATASEWSHVWIEYPSACWGGQWIAHSTEHGVVKEPRHRVRARYNRVCSFEVQGADLIPGMMSSKGIIGLAYDFKVIWNIILLVIHRVTRWKWLWNLTIKDVGRLTCSEFVATVMKRSSLPEVEGVDPEFVTPGVLFELCKNSKTFRLVGENR